MNHQQTEEKKSPHVSSEESLNECFMVNEEEEVTSTSTLVIDIENDHESSSLNDINDDHDTFSNEELLNAFNELYVNFEKMCLKNKTLQKKLDLLSNELEALKSKNEYLLVSNKEFSMENDLKETKLKSPTDALNEKSILNRKISNSCDHDKGVQKFHSQRANFKSSSIHTSHDIRCFHCFKFGHITCYCPSKRKSSSGPKIKWIPKGTKISSISHIKPQGSKCVLKPKNDHFKRNVHKDKGKTNFK